MASITVWLTSYNHAPFLRESIESILNQTWSDFEFYIIDDCSTDNSWEIIQSYQDPRIHAIRHETNWGSSGMWQILESLTGEYLAIAHCDDKWMPDKLEKQLAFLQKHPEVAACFTRVQVIDENGQFLDDSETFYGRAFAQENRSRQEWLRSFFEKGCSLCHPSMLIRNECYKKYSMFSNGLSSIPDLYRWIQLCKHAEIHILQEKLTCFRIRRDGKNTSGDNFRAHCRNATEMYFILPEYIRGCSREDFLKIFPEAEQWLTAPQIPIEYAYARILLQKDRSKIHHLYGMELLYQSLQDPDVTKILKEYAGFDNRVFSDLKTEEDILSIIPKAHLMCCKVYFDFGDGFSDEKALLFDPLYVDWNDRFSLSFSMEKEEVQRLSEGRPVRNIRLDPDEGNYRQFLGVNFYADGEKLEGEPQMAHHMEGDTVVFDTIDPQYAFEVKKNFRRAYVEGYTRPRNMWEVDGYMSQTRKNCAEKAAQLEALQSRAEETARELERLKTENSTLLAKCEELDEQLQKGFFLFRRRQKK